MNHPKAPRPFFVFRCLAPPECGAATYSSESPDCGGDQKISDKVGQRTSHCLFGSVPCKRGQSPASSLSNSGIGICGPCSCIKRSVCSFPWRGQTRQAISISAVRAATAPSRIEPPLTIAPRARRRARDAPDCPGQSCWEFGGMSGALSSISLAAVGTRHSISH